MKIILKKDSRLFNYHAHPTIFGTVSEFSTSLFVGGNTLNDIEPVGSILCTCFTADKNKTADTTKLYDHQWLWTQMNALGKTTSQGASPQDAFSTAVKGQKVVASNEIDTSTAYVQVELGQQDYFSNVKTFIQNEKNKGFNRPVGCGTLYYQEWVSQTLLASPQNPSAHTSHEWQIVGWDADHPNCLKIDAHIGFYQYMPQSVFNAVMDATYGSVALAFVETTQEQLDVLKSIKVSLIQRALDLAYNLYQILRAKLAFFPSN